MLSRRDESLAKPLQHSDGTMLRGRKLSSSKNVRNCCDCRPSGCMATVNNSRGRRTQKIWSSSSLFAVLCCYTSLTSDATGVGSLVESTTKLIEQETCNMEIVNATCSSPGEALLMHSARYGRMKVGRCVKRNLGYVGCAVDVLPVMDARCSGRRRCEFNLPEPSLYDTQPCPADTTSYLEMSYQCIAVAGEQGLSCRGGEPVRLTSPIGYIRGMMINGMDLQDQPVACFWSIQVERGQKINLTMLNLNRAGTTSAGPSSGTVSASSSAWRADVCIDYAALTEGGSGLEDLTGIGSGGGAGSGSRDGGGELVSKTLRICGGDRRENHLYKSKTNKVDIVLLKQTVAFKYAAFIIKYEAISCPDVTPPVGGKVRRDGDLAVITCTDSNEVWYLTCKDVKWIGKHGNCTYALATSANGFQSGRDSFPYGILIVVAVGVALGVLLGGLLLILVVFYMKRRGPSCPTETPMFKEDISPSFLQHNHALPSPTRKYTGGGFNDGRSCYFESTLPALTPTERQVWDGTVKFVHSLHHTHDPALQQLACAHGRGDGDTQRRCTAMACTDGSLHPVELVSMQASATDSGGGAMSCSVHDQPSLCRPITATVNRYQDGRQSRHHTYDFPTCL